MAKKSRLSDKQANALKRKVAKYNTRTAEVEALRPEVDAAVREAIESGGTFREVAEISDRSIAWVQGSLQRSQNK